MKLKCISNFLLSKKNVHLKIFSIFSLFNILFSLLYSFFVHYFLLAREQISIFWPKGFFLCTRRTSWPLPENHQALLLRSIQTDRQTFCYQLWKENWSYACDIRFILSLWKPRRGICRAHEKEFRFSTEKIAELGVRTAQRQYANFHLTFVMFFALLFAKVSLFIIAIVNLM